MESTELNLSNLYKMRKKLLRSLDDDCFGVALDDYNFIDEDFRMLVKENNKFIATVCMSYLRSKLVRTS